MNRRIWLALARLIGLLIRCIQRLGKAMARAQTQCLSIAEFYGWRPENDAQETELRKRQFQLFCYRMEKAVKKKGHIQ